MKHDPRLTRLRLWQIEADRKRRREARIAASSALAVALVAGAAMRLAMDAGSTGGAVLAALVGTLALIVAVAAGAEA
jgi:hypothetical protein